MPTKKRTQKVLPKGEHLEIPATIQSAQNVQNFSSGEVKTLLAWTAPGRPFRKRSRQFFITAILAAFLVEVVLFLFSQYLLMLVVVSLVFVSFVLATVSPRNFNYRISNQGVTVEDHSYLWIELYDFYFKKRDSVDVLHVRTKAFIPGDLTLTLGGIDREHIKGVLVIYLPYRETIKPTFMEKSADWLTKNFPLEKTT